MESEAIVTSRCGRRAALGSAGAVAWMVLIVAIAHVGHAPRLAAAQQAASPVELRVAWWGSPFDGGVGCQRRARGAAHGVGGGRWRRIRGVTLR